MSNPAVIFLSDCITKEGTSFRVEDNIGECIHIHYGNLRLDLSVNDFLNLAKEIRSSLVELFEDIENFDLDHYDPIFLADLGASVLDIKSVTTEKISIDDLLVYRKVFKNIPVASPLKKSMMYRALNGDTAEYLSYGQENNKFQSNEDRINGVSKFIDEKGYGEDTDAGLIVLFNNQNIIRDGQHRAAVLLKSQVQNLKVARFNFKNQENNISESPWISFLFKWNLSRLKNIARSLLNKFRYLKKRFYYKFLNN